MLVCTDHQSAALDPHDLCNMKYILVLATILAAVTTTPLEKKQNWPWQEGKVYHYDVDSYAWTKFEGFSIGNSFKTQFEVRVQAPGKLLVKIVNSQYAKFKAQLSGKDIPSDLKYQPVKDFDQIIEIIVDGGRIISFKLPSSFTNNEENLLKGFMSALQVDVSTFDHVDDYPNSFDKESFQGQFKKWENDVTGRCETLYSVAPLSADCHRELPNLASEEDPIEIIKSKSYESCQNYIEKRDFIDYTTEAHLVVGKKGNIYKSEVITTVFANPHLGGKQKTEVYSYVKLLLKTVQQNNDSEWPEVKEYRYGDTLLFKMDNTLAPFTYGGEQNVAKVQQVLQEMTPLLQDPDTLPKNDFLLKFEILVSLLRSFNSEQFNQMSSGIEIAKTSKNIAKNGMWIIYRDAVAQAGTAEAYKQIKYWVLNKKIEGEEAAELITAIGAAAAANPTLPKRKLLVDFFDFTKSPEVIAQTSVHNAALLAFTKLVRYAGQDQLVIETVIPYLSNELKLAVQDKITSKAQIYVRVLGNLAYPEILKVFAPYLDGTVPVSKYLRIQMVTNLKTVANLKDPYVCTVLYSILKNTAEPYEVRVAAALNIFLALPTTEMFQVMAHMTYADPSTQVRAVLSNGIIFAAGLKEPQFADLAQRAQAVLPKVTKVKYGYRYSTDSIMDGYTGKDEFSFFRELSYIGSENHILPKYQRSALRFKNTGVDDEQQVTLSVSDVLDFVSFFKSTYQSPHKPETDFKFSAKQLNELLNIKRSSRQPLEGALFLDNLNQQKLVTFSEDELSRFFDKAYKYLGYIMGSGFSTQYTKILFTKTDYVLLPLASGMPFLLIYSQPLVIIAQVQGEEPVYGKEKKSKEFKIDITVNRNVQGCVGFVDTVGKVISVGGVINRVQLRLPTKLTVSYNRADMVDMELKFEPLQTEKDVNMIHFSVWPFIGTQKQDAAIYDIETIKRSYRTFDIDEKIGKEINMLYHLKGYTYSSDFKNWDMFKDDVLTNVGNFVYQKDIAFTEFDLKYLNQESTCKAVTFSFYIGLLYNQNKKGEMGKAALPMNKQGVARRDELVNKVSAGIKSAEVKIFEINAKFDEEKQNEWSFISAIAFSLVDPKFQAGVFARSFKNELSAVFQLNQQDTKIVPLNFEEALKNKVNVTYDISIVVDNVTILGKGIGWRSEQYAEQLMDDAKGKTCLYDVSQNNLYQIDCHKLIIKAHAPDMFRFKLQVENPVTVATFPNLVNLYTVLNGIPLQQLWGASSMDENTVKIVARLAYNDNRMEYEFNTKYGSVTLKQEALSYYPYALAMYGPITPYERTRNWFTGYQDYPFCTIDDSKVKTFSGRSYNYSLTGSWHVVMLDEADDTNWNDLVILARRPKVNEEEVYISYNSGYSNYLEIEIKPNNVEVKSNGVKAIEGPYTLYLNQDGKMPLLEYYNLAEGVQAFHILDTEFRIIYDKQRLVIFTDAHRSTTRGICGQSSSQIGDDYLTPWGLVDLPEHYGAAFSLEGDFSDPKTVSLKNESKLKAYQPVTTYTKILHSDAEWSKVLNKSIKKF